MDLLRSEQWKRGEISASGEPSLTSLHLPMMNLSGSNLTEIDWSRSGDLKLRVSEPLTQSMTDQAVLLPARIFREGSHPRSSTLFDYFKGKGVIFVEEGEEVEREMRAFPSRFKNIMKKPFQKGNPFLPLNQVIFVTKRSPLISIDFKQSSSRKALSLLRNVTPLPRDMESNEELQREIKAHLSGSVNPSEQSPFSILLRHLRDWQRREVKSRSSLTPSDRPRG